MADSDDDSEMIRKPDDNENKFTGMASGVGGFDAEPQPKGSIYTKMWFWFKLIKKAKA